MLQHLVMTHEFKFALTKTDAGIRPQLGDNAAPWDATTAPAPMLHSEREERLEWTTTMTKNSLVQFRAPTFAMAGASGIYAPPSAVRTPLRALAGFAENPTQFELVGCPVSKPCSTSS